MSRLRIVVLSVLVICASILVPASAASGSSNAPMQRASGIPAIGSFNWSGYAVTSPSSARFTYVHSRFVQPALSCPGVKNQVMSAWVGLDGFTNGTVEQTGTAAACKGPHHTDPVYYAWYEMFPANSVAVFPVAPGDVIDTVVSFANKQFTLTVSDLTSGRTKSTTATCAGCKRASAEWIVERPASCKTVNPFSGCFIDALANFDTVTMTQNLAQLAGGKVSAITAFPRNKIVMVDLDPNGGIRLLDTTSALGGQSFTETWLQAGSIIPIQL
jgi:hypothetical protein